MWDLPGPGFEPVPLAMAGGFFTTEPSGKPNEHIFFNLLLSSGHLFVPHPLCLSL